VDEVSGWSYFIHVLSGWDYFIQEASSWNQSVVSREFFHSWEQSLLLLFTDLGGRKKKNNVFFFAQHLYMSWIISSSIFTWVESSRERDKGINENEAKPGLLSQVMSRPLSCSSNAIVGGKRYVVLYNKCIDS
jgi:hypothetical protein